MWVIERTLAYAFIVAVGLNFFNVVGRYGFGITILSADELQIFIMVFMAISLKTAGEDRPDRRIDAARQRHPIR